MSVNDGHGYTAPAGSFPGDASPYGAFDMAGNVMEWCLDWYDARAYVRYGEGNLAPPEIGEHRVIRGGFWGLSVDRGVSHGRSWAVPEFKGIHLGFRALLPSRSRRVG
jgi:formylglycine-generating enzyme required for sulfatase activity